MEKLICPNCGKENTTEHARFCAFCGGELAKSSVSAAEQTVKLCAELKDTYINYINWSSNYLATRSAGKVFGAIFTGDSDYKTRDEHTAFVSDCEAAAARLLQNFSSPDCDRAAVLRFLDYALFDVYDHCGDEAGWMILACEKHYLPFLELLRRDELEQLYPRYKAFRKKKMNLPTQDEMLKKMKKLSKSKI